jgi:hypothetical protein
MMWQKKIRCRLAERVTKAATGCTQARSLCKVKMQIDGTMWEAIGDDLYCEEGLVRDDHKKRRRKRRERRFEEKLHI